MSLRLRLVLTVLAIAIPATLVSAWLAWATRRDAALEAAQQALIDRMDGDGRERCELDPQRFGARGRRMRARLFAYDATMRPASDDAPIGQAALAEALEGDRDVALLTLPDGTAAIAARMPWDDGPCAVIVSPLPALSRGLRREAIGRALTLPAITLVAALLSALAALAMPLRRLTRLRDAVRASAAGDYRAATGAAGSDEIGELARAFDEAAERVRSEVQRLSERDRALSEYVAATTHDLALPLTVLNGRLARTAERAERGEPIDRAELAGAIAECQYLAALVANLGAVARLDASTDGAEPRELDLSLLVERVIERHAPVARSAGIALERAVPERAVMIVGDDLLLERALSNLVHNAIRHHRAREGEGHVAVVLDVEAGRFRLRVEDDGGLDDSGLARLREGDGKSQGGRAGLGLRIVRRVAAAHGLELRFARGEAGLAVTLEGPLAR